MLTRTPRPLSDRVRGLLVGPAVNVGTQRQRTHTESLQPLLTGVVTTKVVVTTQGGVVTTPISPCFGVRTLTTGSLPPIELQRSHIQVISSPTLIAEVRSALPPARRPLLTRAARCPRLRRTTSPGTARA